MLGTWVSCLFAKGIIIMNKNKKKEILNILIIFLELDKSVDYDVKFEKDLLDSLDKINLLILLEEELSIELSIIELYKCETLGDLCDLCIEGEHD